MLSELEYCPLVWHFCNRDKVKETKQIQKQALRYVFDYFRNASCNELLEKANHKCTPID